MRDKIKMKIYKILRTSAMFIAVVSVFSFLYTFLAPGSNIDIRFIFTANFAVGAFVIAVGLITLILPANLGSKKLIDHTTYVAKSADARERKRIRAFDIIYVGISVILIAGVVEIIVAGLL